MCALQSQIVQYLRADGFEVSLDGALIHAMPSAVKNGKMDLHESGDLVVWPVADQASASLDNQKRFLDLVARVRQNAPTSQGIYVAPKGTSFTGIETLIRAYGFDRQNIIKRRAPIQYFDTPYMQDEMDGRGAKTIVDKVLTSLSLERRIAQPFAIRNTTNWVDTATEDGPDLAEHLFEAMSAPVDGPKVRIIDGPAGGGKSNVFDAVFARYYQHFIENKRSHDIAPRPVLFMPEHMRNKSVANMGELMGAVFESDLAAPVTPEQFRWLLNNGFSIWMFDGLDEFYAGETDFFSFIEQAMKEPDSKAQFLICTRNSLLNTSGRLTNFVDSMIKQNPSWVELYQLLPWGAPQWEQLANKPAPSIGFIEIGRPESENFIRALGRNEHLRELASLPFYCDRILHYWRDHGRRLPPDIFVILERLVDDMLEREQNKLPFDWSVFAAEDKQAIAAAGGQTEEDPGDIINLIGKEILIEFLGAVAHFRRRSAIDQNDQNSDLEIEDIINIFLSAQISEIEDQGMQETYRMVLLAIVQFAFFVPGSDRGTIDFGHEQIAEYLAARYTVRVLRGNPESIEAALGTSPIDPHSLFARYLIRELGKDKQLGGKVLKLMEPVAQSAAM